METQTRADRMGKSDREALKERIRIKEERKCVCMREKEREREIEREIVSAQLLSAGNEDLVLFSLIGKDVFILAPSLFQIKSNCISHMRRIQQYTLQ